MKVSKDKIDIARANRCMTVTALAREDPKNTVTIVTTDTDRKGADQK